MLLKVIMGTAEEGGHILELAVEILPVLAVSDLDVHDQAFSHKMHLLAETLHQYAGVALDLLEACFKSLLHPLKAPVNRLKTRIDGLEPLIDALEALINVLEALINNVKTIIEVLNQFLIHGCLRG